MIDLGSGAGFDAFLAATKVGLNGKVIGVDMNKVRHIRSWPGGGGHHAANHVRWGRG